MRCPAIIAILVCINITAFCQTSVIPANRTADWSDFAGVPDGIPIRSTIFVNVLTTGNSSYKCAGNGSTDDSLSISNALRDCPSNQVVYLPSAVYNLSNRIYFANPSGWTLRGDGPGKTVLKDSISGGAVFSMGQVAGKGNGADDYLTTSNYFPLYGSYVAGSSNLSTTVYNNNGVTLRLGMLVQISQNNDAFVTATGQNGPQTFSSITGDGQHILNQMAQIVATNANGTNITIWPPLLWGYPSSLSPVLYIQDFSAYFVSTVPRQIGFENFTISNALGSASEKHVFDMYCAVQSWLTNIEEIDVKNYGGFLDDCLQCQVDHCYFHTNLLTVPYQNYGWETEFSTYCLFQNNIFSGFFEAHQIDSGSAGNVVFANLYTNYFNSGATGDDTNRCAPGLSTSHGAFPMLNLIEANVGGGIQRDEYWGSSGFDTIFRNLWVGRDAHSGVAYTEDIIPLKIDNASTSNNVVGNILGNATTTWTYYQMAGSLSTYPNAIERFGYPGIDSNTYIGTNSGRQSLDTTVLSTMILRGNYDYKNAAIDADPGVTLTNSYAITSKPLWWGNLSWPAFNSTNLATASVTNIPAGYRFVFGVDPPSGGATDPTMGTVSLTSYSSNSVTVSVQANPNSADTLVYINVGTTTAYGSTSTGSDIGSGAVNASGTVTVNGLTANTLYHFQGSATNGIGGVVSSDQTFTTQPVYPVTYR